MLLSRALKASDTLVSGAQTSHTGRIGSCQALRRASQELDSLASLRISSRTMFAKLNLALLLCLALSGPTPGSVVEQA